VRQRTSLTKGSIVAALIAMVPLAAWAGDTRVDTKRLERRTPESKSEPETVEGSLTVTAPVTVTDGAAESDSSASDSSDGGNTQAPDGDAPAQLERLSAGDIQLYDLLGAKELSSSALSGLSAVIVKGAPKADQLRSIKELIPASIIVNYEQAFALNSTEASYARDHGYLAETCSGAEIHPANIQQMTLLDATNRAAVAWRAQTISSETEERGMDGTYLDTLRSIFPTSFYDGTPCGLRDEEWLAGSISLLDEVKAQTGKFVIANGSGLQSGRNYFKYQAAADQLIAHADAVQIEHFARSSDVARDVAFFESLRSKGKTVFAKCDGSTETCTSAFLQAAGSDDYLAL
jgi:hypothetical protein